MTTEELGQHLRHLTDAVVARDVAKILVEVGPTWDGAKDLVSGFLSGGGVHFFGAQHDELHSLAEELSAACEKPHEGFAAKETGAALDPSKIATILAIVKAIAELIKSLKS